MLIVLLWLLAGSVRLTLELYHFLHEVASRNVKNNHFSRNNFLAVKIQILDKQVSCATIYCMRRRLR